MMWIIYLMVFVFGLVFGSFLNVVVYRSTHGTSPLSGRSRCPKCRKKISWQYNIPVLSYLFLKGRCINCKKKISWQYPFVEIVTGFMFLWWYFVGMSFFRLVMVPAGLIQPLFWLIVGMIFVTIVMTDFLYGLIPDKINLFFFVLVVFYRVYLVWFGFMQVNDFVNGLISSVGVWLFFLLLVWITKGRGMGWGDVKLSPTLALLLGWPRSLIGLFFSFVIGSILGVGLILNGKRKFGQTIPFGPFMIAGSMVALIWGYDLWNWYFGMLQ